MAERKPSESGTQGGRIPEGMWPTEDAEMRRFPAGQAAAYLRRGALSVSPSRSARDRNEHPVRARLLHG